MIFFILLLCLLSKETCSNNEQLQLQRIVDDILTNGEWIRCKTRPYNYRIHNFSYHIDYITQKEYHWSFGQCSESVYSSGQLYKWNSTSARALNKEFSVINIYKYLNGKNLLIVGDSLSDEFHMTLLHMLWSDSDNALPTYAVDWRDSKRILKMSFSGYSFNLIYVRSFYLLPNPIHSRTLVSVINEHPWLQFITPGTILILNKGAHFTPESEYIMRLKNTFNAIIARYRNLIDSKSLLVVFRDTPLPLHSGQYFFNDPPLSLKNIKTNYSKQELSWGWDRFDKENHLSQQLILKYYPWVIFMNISGSTLLRVDSRRDDMHFCIPGPVDHWVMKLVEILHVWGIYRSTSS